MDVKEKLRAEHCGDRKWLFEAWNEGWRAALEGRDCTPSRMAAGFAAGTPSGDAFVHGFYSHPESGELAYA